VDLRRIEQVGSDLIAGSDELAVWAKDRERGFFVRPDPAVLQSLSGLSAWVSTHGYEPGSVHSFLQGSDLYLVAHARAHDQIVVTHETAAPASIGVEIPDVCTGLNVEWTTPFEMLRREQARFVLG
jgi:hypothetical protein